MSKPAQQLLEAYEAVSNLPGNKIIHATSDELVDKFAHDLMLAAEIAVDDRDAFHLALSGGSTPQVLYQRLMIDPQYRDFPWSKTHVYLVDDRCVPFDSEKSNWKMLTELLIEPGDLKEDHVHPMQVLDDDGAQQYDTLLRQHLDNDKQQGRLDFILLGMGPDGHTASLFPHTPGLTETEKWVIFNDGQHVIAPRPRMTMTYPLINASRIIANLITGAGKFDMLQRVNNEPDNKQELPITGITPTHDDTTFTWYLDLPAATGK